MQNNRLLDTIKIKVRNIISEFEIENIDFTLNEFENRFRLGSKRSKMDPFEFRNSLFRDLENPEKQVIQETIAIPFVP